MQDFNENFIFSLIWENKKYSKLAIMSVRRATTPEARTFFKNLIKKRNFKIQNLQKFRKGDEVFSATPSARKTYGLEEMLWLGE